MPGGLLQLVAYGSQNMLLNTSQPQVTFFKSVFRTHSHFSMEPYRLEFSRRDVSISETTRISCKIGRHGDLLSNLYLVVELPDLWVLRESAGRDASRIRWIERLGEFLIDSYHVNVGGTVVDRQYGEWMFIWRELTLPISKMSLYNRMIGHTPSVFDPDLNATTIYTEEQYTQGTAKPFVSGRTLTIPLNFWFNRYAGVALPMVSLQYHDVYLNVDVRAIKSLYQVRLVSSQVPQGDAAYDAARRGEYIAPKNLSNPAEHIRYYARNNTRVTPQSLDISPYLEANFVFLDEAERKKFVEKSQEYLIDQLMRIEKFGLKGTRIIDLVLQNPVRELVIIARKQASVANNQWTRLVDESGDALIKTMKILFDGQERVQEKPYEYYSQIQVFQHHSCTPIDGVMVYSFALDPEGYQPTGHCNMSRIPSVQLHIQFAEGVQADVVVYATNHNFFRVAGGMAGVAFAM
jgi:hypothetical protein